MAQAVGTTAINFQGSPRNLQGLVSVAFEEIVPLGLPRLELSSPPAEARAEPIVLQIEDAGPFTTWLRFSLPESTTPGTYEGTVSIGADQWPALVEINARLALTISPRRLTFQAAPGAELGASITVVNVGNVALEIPKVHKVGLLDIKGPERAIGLALGDTATDGFTRLGLFAEEMARSHGGRLVLTVEEGEGSLAPGEFRHLRLALRLPDDLKVGRMYTGEWMLLNRSYSIEVLAVDGAPAQGES
jgi:hypothetical protein